MKASICSVLLFLVAGCAINNAPKGFTYKYDGEDAGLNKLIDVNGLYVFEWACDSTYQSLVMFYPDGLLATANTDSVFPELIDCFEHGGKSNLCKYISWGTYVLEGKTIKVQIPKDEGIGKATVHRTYEIEDNGTFVNMADYVIPEDTNLGYMKNYPSFRVNPCVKTATFRKLDKKRSIDECPHLTKKWFKGTGAPNK